MHACFSESFAKSREGKPTALSSDEEKEKARIGTAQHFRPMDNDEKERDTPPPLEFHVYSRTGGKSASVEAWVKENKICNKIKILY